MINTNLLKIINKVISIVALVFYFGPIIILWDNSIVRIHDVLDSYNVFKVLIDSGNLFKTGADVKVNQIMNGLPRDCFPSAFYLVNLFIYWFGSTTGFFINYILTHLIAFVGTWFFLNALPVKRDEYNFNWLIATSFAILPFNVLAGISLAGIPMVGFAFLLLQRKSKIILASGLIILYCLYSSMIHAGVFVIASAIMYLVLNLKNRAVSYRLLYGIALMLLSYGLIEFNLLKSLLVSKTYISHRVEFVNHLTLNFKGVVGVSFYNLIGGNYGSANYFGLPIILLAISAFFFMYNRKQIEWTLFYTFALLVLVSFLVAFLDLKNLEVVYNSFKIIETFNLRRFHFLLPVLIIILLKYSIDYFITWNTNFVSMLSFICITIILGNFYIDKKYNSNLNYNKRDVTFRQFFSNKLFSEVDAFIKLPKSTYRVVSVGIEPTVTQCYGFYTLDSYQNNYPLDYKHRFHQIIQKELLKDSIANDYFMNWGNRCYIPFQTDSILNGVKMIKDLAINTEVLKEMNCKFIISAYKILNEKLIGLQYKEIFRDNESNYEVYLYEII